MFTKLLIANRGEIACRIARTARRMGVRTVAVYSDADAGALHVHAADEAVHIGSSPATASYLDIERIMHAAHASGAQALHPGYGFLSENADLAEACARNGIVFVGPDPAAIRIMGSKSEAKALLAAHEVPLVPGYYGADQDASALAAHAEAIGYPLLVKASAGGGGRGMRVVRDRRDFAPALASAQREAQSAFGDARVLLEKYVESPRHIEVQIFGDRHGGCVHLFERDCSVQRRHQKVIEEAPAPGLSAAQREQLYRAALAVGRAVAYVGAGTVEFVLDPGGALYFIEMNTRLQVEHPVTELVTDLDLVEWQLRVAAGERLPASQADIRLRGHAVEARLYAEDPAQDFRPSTGTIGRLRLPPADAGLRIDSGVDTGSTVSPFYDAMIAKLIAWAPDRAGALERLAGALTETTLAGLSTNLDYLQRIVTHPRMRAGGVTTHFIDDEKERLVCPPPAPTGAVLALATAWELRALERAATRARARSADVTSPWHSPSGFRLNGTHAMAYRYASHHGTHEVQVEFDPAGPRVLADGEAFGVDLAAAGDPDDYAVTAGERRLRGTVLALGDALHVRHAGADWRFQPSDPLHTEQEDDGAAGSLTAPMPGVVAAVLVAVGDSVTRGTALVVLEAMKIEHTIVAPCDGVVREIRFVAGEQVTAEGVELVLIEPAEAAQ